MQRASSWPATKLAFALGLCLSLTVASVAADAASVSLRALNANLVSSVHHLSNSVVAIHAASPISQMQNRNVGKELQLKSPTRVGTGVIVEDGLTVLTTVTVVGDSKVVTVRLPTRNHSVQGKVEMRDPATGLATIRLDTPLDRARPAPLANVQSLAPGSMVLLIGYAYGSIPYYQMGLVLMQKPHESLAVGAPMLWISAPTQPGTSGGAVVDSAGRIVGIIHGQASAQLIAHSDSAPRISVALPIAKARKLLTSEPQQDESRGWLGVYFSMDSESVLIDHVIEGSPAAESNLRANDRILKVDDTPIQTPSEFVSTMSGYEAGETVALELKRNGRVISTSAKLGSRPDHFWKKKRYEQSKRKEFKGTPPNTPYLGVSLANLTSLQRRAVSIDGQSGVLIRKVLDESPAAQAGVHSGDVLLRVDDESIQEVEDLGALIQTCKVGDKLQLTLWRRGARLKREVELSDRPSSAALATALHPQMNDAMTEALGFVEHKLDLRHGASFSALQERIEAVRSLRTELEKLNEELRQAQTLVD